MPPPSPTAVTRPASKFPKLVGTDQYGIEVSRKAAAFWSMNGPASHSWLLG